MNEETGLRLDVWLWRTRFFKTRALAAKLITTKGVRIDRTGLVRKTSKPGALVAASDILTFRKDKAIITLKVEGIPDRRGPAPEAQACYDLIEEDET